MKAMIFAAGLGTRLYPYTQALPKALVPVAGVPMLEIVVKRLISFGIYDIVINVHHFARQVIDFVEQKDKFGINIHFSDETGLLLDTGGGLKKASWFLEDSEPFLLHNVDVLSKVDFREMERMHNESKSLATLAVSERKSSRYFLFDKDMRLCGWENQSKGEQVFTAKADTLSDCHRYGFSGIHVISPAIFQQMPEVGRFSIVDVYLQLSGEFRISGFIHSPTDWLDMGRPEDIEKAALLLDNENGFM